MDNLYSKNDLSELLKVSVGTIDNKMKDGSIEFYKIGKSVRFSDIQIDDFLKTYRIKKYIANQVNNDSIERLQSII
jgi:excisionase family DNA binding protein